MASKQGTTTTTTTTTTTSSATAPPTIGGNLPAMTLPEHPARNKTLKRARQEQPLNSPNHSLGGGISSPPLKSPRYAINRTPASLTGAAALADAQMRKENQAARSFGMSENPNQRVLSSLMAGSDVGMSKPRDAPVATMAMSRGMSVASDAIAIPGSTQFSDDPDISPASVTSLASLGSTTPTATANSAVVTSPTNMTGSGDLQLRAMQLQDGGSDDRSNRAQTYSGSMVTRTDQSRVPPRGLSLPMSSLNQPAAPRPPGPKKHKCPYCETEFTRHHNLKSHLLTHSQEKPYVCKTCSMRFRRLHDLKRHAKLHTGERPHICPKCDRKFARGDALARHSKGQGGCAGRRSSMGNFGAEEGEPDDGRGADAAMEGVTYDGAGEEDRDVSEDDQRRFSLPAIKAQHVNDDQGGSPRDDYEGGSRGPSTYPPAGPRPAQSSGGLYPPHNDRGGSSGSTSPSLQNGIPGGHTPTASMSNVNISPGGSMLSHGGMTESPKPLSPAGMHSHQLGHDSNMVKRQRSPSLATQFQHQQFGRRRQSGRSPPPGTSLSSPPHVGGHGPNGPKLPSLQGLAPPDSRFTLTSQVTAQQHGTGVSAGSGPPPGQVMRARNNGNPAIQHGPAPCGRGGGGPRPQLSGNGDSNNMFASEKKFWDYVTGLQEKVRQLSERVSALEQVERNQGEKNNRLTEEVDRLTVELNSRRGQSQQQHSQQQPQHNQAQRNQPHQLQHKQRQ